VTGDGADANPGDGVCATASGNCSLRAAIQESNAIAGTDNIYFDIPGTGVKTISPGSSLPDITSAVYIDGYTQTGASQNTLQNGDNAVLTIELNGLNSGVAYGLKIVAGGCTVRGLVIRTFSEGQISLTTNGGNAIEGNFIGTNAAGTAQGFCNGVPGAATDGIDIFTGNNTIGGTTAAVRNIISGNCGSGIEIVSGNRNNILGNFIGTDASGTLPLGNLQSGVLIAAGATNNVVGGAPDATRNIISGNGQRGIEITGTGTSGNQVQNNFIGVDVSGTAAVGNLQSGVLINSGASNNTIGGAWPDGAAAVGNVIAFNNDRGVRVAGSNSTGNAILTNSIFSNGNIGIDLGNDGVTPNNSLGHIGPNN